MLVPRGLRHILQHAQPLLNRTLPVRRKLLPLRQDIALNVVALFRRQPAPIGSCLSHLLLLSWRQLLKALVVLENFLLLLPRQTVESLWRRSVCQRRPARIIIRPRRHPRATWVRGRRPMRVRIRRTVRARVLPLALRSPRILLLLSLLLPLFLSWLLPWLLLARRLLSRRRLALLLWRPILLSILGPIRARSLRKARHGQRRAHSQRHQPSRELEFPFHFRLHLLILVCVASFIGLHRLRQLAQRRKIRNHIVVFQNLHVLVYRLDFTRI